MSDLTDADFDGFRRGDRKVFEKISLALGDRFVMRLRSAGVPEEQVKDLLQEMWLSAIEKASSFHGSTLGQLSNWLYVNLLRRLSGWIKDKDRSFWKDLRSNTDDAWEVVIKAATVVFEKYVHQRVPSAKPMDIANCVDALWLKARENAPKCSARDRLSLFVWLSFIADEILKNRFASDEFVFQPWLGKNRSDWFKDNARSVFFSRRRLPEAYPDQADGNVLGPPEVAAQLEFRQKIWEATQNGKFTQIERQCLLLNYFPWTEEEVCEICPDKSNKVRELFQELDKRFPVNVPMEESKCTRQLTPDQIATVLNKGDDQVKEALKRGRAKLKPILVRLLGDDCPPESRSPE